MSKKTIRAYIGANNTTGKVDKETLLDILNARHLGFTVVDAIGYWEGQQEPSVVVDISDEESRIMATLRRVKQALKQEAVAFTTSDEIKVL